VAAYDAAGNTSAQSASASATTQASSGGGLPTSPGWYQIPNTRLDSVCAATHGFPQVAGAEGCPAITADWSGGIADTSRNRLIVWGGGHGGYYGNEIYALDLNSLTMLRLNDPTPPLGTCAETLAGPTPNSRHTYDGLAYIPSLDRMVSVTGSMAPCGAASSATWALNVGSLQWTQQNPSGGQPNYQGGLAATSYDPNTSNVFVHTESYAQFWSYSFSTNTYKLLNGSAATDYHETSIIDSKRKLFFIFGNGQAFKIDISGNDASYTMRPISATGCGFVGQIYPGLAFDTAQNLVVGWAGGDTVYLYNPDTDSCSSVTYSGGPGAQVSNGTYKRFSYFPALNVFALVNNVTQNAYALRLTPGTGGGTGPVISGVGAGGITATGATISWTTNVASTTQVEYGTTTSYGTLTTVNPTLVASHSQDLMGLPAGTYHYRVHSKDSTGVESISGNFSFSTTSSSGIVDAVPFTQRCAASGVFRCIGFDSPSDFVTSGGPPTQTVYDAGNDIRQDCTVSASGGCSLRITLPGPSNPAATDASKYEWDFVNDNRAFGQNSTFYIQFRTRMDHSIITNNFGGEGWKQFLIYGGLTSCSSLGLVTQNQNYWGFPTMFHECSPGIFTTIGSNIYVEQGDYNCLYPSFNATNCSFYHENEWETYYYKIHVGNWGQANSIVEAWVAYGTSPLKKWIDQQSFTINFQNSSSDVLDKVAFTSYITARSAADTAASDGHTWFDELILSTQPISAPNGPTP
jgi:hypothetical protein